MLKVVKVKADAQGNLSTPLPDILTCGGGCTKGTLADVHFGTNQDIIVITVHNKGLSRDNLERIRILTEVKDTTKFTEETK